MGSAHAAEGDAATGLRLLMDSVRVCEEIGYLMGRGLGHAALALAWPDRGPEARSQAATALALFQAADLPWGVLVAYGSLATMAASRGDWADAVGLWRESLTLALSIGSTWGLPLVLDGVAAWAAAGGAVESAAGLLGAAAALRQRQGAVSVGDERATPVGDRVRGSILAAPGTPAFEAAWSAGQRWTTEQAINEALARLAELTEPDSVAGHRQPEAPGGRAGGGRAEHRCARSSLDRPPA